MVEWPRVEAMPGAALALSALSVVPVQCVATNATDSDAAMVGEALERVGLRNHLAGCFTSSELGASKPDPRFFEKVAAALGIPPGNLMAVGNDLQKDIVPAKEVGMNTVLVSPSLELCADEGADLVVPSLIQLAELFLDGIRGNLPVDPGRV